MKKRKKILAVGEASFLSTGYAVYQNEVLKRLHATGKFEIAELGCYGSSYDSRSSQIPWRFYGNLPNMEDKKAVDRYGSDVINAFGKYNFDSVLLDFKPDIVFDIRDYWMISYQEKSAFRDIYHWCIMPTVDSEPQHNDWIGTYMNADSVFCYTDWGVNVLSKQSGGLINVLGSNPPGADINVFKPVTNKEQHRASAGMSKDLFIVGTVMRNQIRKLYPNLLDDFKKYLDYCKEHNQELYDKSFLYLHVCYPDLGWNIPSLILNSGLSTKIIMTYACNDCGYVFPSFFQDPPIACHRCGSSRAYLPSTMNGISREDLSRIMNYFDAYVQYASNEGFGMPQVEAASCGVPVFATDYSAMSDVVRKVSGYPIKVKALYYDHGTEGRRAIPDGEDFVNKLYSFANLPQPIRNRKGMEARVGVQTHYDWDKVAEKWFNHFDSIEHIANWNCPARIHNIVDPSQALGIQGNEAFVNWCYINLLGREDLINTHYYFKYINDLNYGVRIARNATLLFDDQSFMASDNKFVSFTRQDLVKEFVTIRETWNYWETQRIGAK